MRKTSPVLALSTILAGFLLAAAQHPANAACVNGSSSGCDNSGPGVVQLAQAGMRPGPEDLRAKDPDVPAELWDRWDKIRRLPLPGPELEDLNARMADIVHKIMDARAHARDSQKKIDDADSAIDKLKSDMIAAEGEKHAAQDEEARQEGRFIAALQNALHDFRPPPPPRPPEDWRARRGPPDDWRARRWFRPRPVFHHYCPPLYPPPFPPPFPPPWREHEYPPPREREFYPLPPRREYEFREIRPICCGCEHRL
jgi:hypothetical protein